MSNPENTPTDELAAKRAARKAPAKKVPAKRTPAAKAPAKKAPAKPAKKAPAKRGARGQGGQAGPSAAQAAAVVKAERTDQAAVLHRIAELRAEGLAWRPLSAKLNDEGYTTVRGKQFTSNGTTAFLLAKNAGI